MKAGHHEDLSRLSVFMTEHADFAVRPLCGEAQMGHPLPAWGRSPGPPAPLRYGSGQPALVSAPSICEDAEPGGKSSPAVPGLPHSCRKLP